MKTYLMKSAHRSKGRARRAWGLALAAAALTWPWTVIAAGPDPVDLGEAGHFTLLAGSAITSAGGDIYGDAGVSPASGSFIGLDPAQMKLGIIYAVDAAGPAGSTIDPTLLTAAKGDLTIAYNDAAGRTPVPTGDFLNPGSPPGNIGGLNLVPGLYKFTSDALITGSDVTLTGGPDDVWIFQIATALTVGAAGRSVILAGGARAENVFWQVGSSATIGTYADFKGTIMADQHIVLGVGSKLEGRALARIAHVVFDGEVATLPALKLTIVSEHGTGDPSVGTYNHDYGAALTNSVTGMETLGGTQYVNTGWAMTGNDPLAGTTNHMEMVITNNAVLTWQWSTNYLLNASATLGGTVTGDTNGFYAAGSSVAVTAVPDPGYLFVGWTGDVGGAPNAATQTLTMDQARTLVAHFVSEAVDCGTPVTLRAPGEGAFMELDLSALFPGTGWTYAAVSTLPGVMSAAITSSDLLRLEALSLGVTLITVNAVKPGDALLHSFPVQVVGHPNVLSIEMAPHEPWNPRFEQRIVVENDTGIDCPAIGLRLLFSDIQPGIVIENQTGLTPSPDGRPMMEWSTDFPNGAQQSLSVIYLSTGEFRPDEYPPTVEVQYILPNVYPAPDQAGGPNIVSLRMLADRRVVLEFESIPGNDYEIDHAPTASGLWQTVPLLLHAGANRTQWIDYGPPVTPPLTNARFYRVRGVSP